MRWRASAGGCNRLSQLELWACRVAQGFSPAIDVAQGFSPAMSAAGSRVAQGFSPAMGAVSPAIVLHAIHHPPHVLRRSNCTRRLHDTSSRHSPPSLLVRRPASVLVDAMHL